MPIEGQPFTDHGIIQEVDFKVSISTKHGRTSRIVFTLKTKDNTVHCTAWGAHAININCDFKEGDLILVEGKWHNWYDHRLRRKRWSISTFKYTRCTNPNTPPKQQGKNAMGKRRHTDTDNRFRVLSAALNKFIPSYRKTTGQSVKDLFCEHNLDPEKFEDFIKAKNILCTI